MHSQTFFKEENVNLLVIFFIGLSLSIAYGAELVYHLKPCSLCVYLRLLYWAILVTSLVLIRWLAYGWLKILRFVLIAVALATSFYHLGVEQKWWQEPSTCHNPGTTRAVAQADLSVHQKIALLRQSIQSADSIPRCSQVNWRVFGVSVTVWNTLALAGLLIFLLTASRYRKHEP